MRTRQKRVNVSKTSVFYAAMMEAIFGNPDVIAFVSAGAAVAVVVLIWQAFLPKDSMAARLKSITERRNALREEMISGRRRKKTATFSAQEGTLIQRIVAATRLNSAAQIEKLRRDLTRAGWRSREAVTMFLFTKIALTFGLVILSVVLFSVLKVAVIKPGLVLLIHMFMAVLGWILPDVLLKNQAQKRGEILQKAFPDALDLLVICAEAGLSIDAALERVSREMGQGAPELAEELGLTSVELNFLPDRSKAYQGLADRVPLSNVLALVNTLVQTERYGTPLAQALRVLSSEMRDERMMKAEEKAARLPAVLTVPIIVFILPTIFMVLAGPAAIRVMETMAKNHH